MKHFSPFKKLSFLLLFANIFLFNCCQSANPDTQTESGNPPLETAGQDTIPNQAPQKEQLPHWPVKAQKITGVRMPFDEGPQNPDFVAFRKRLFQAVLDKDTSFLASIIHPDIKFSLGDGHGKAEFLAGWQLDTNPGASSFWEEFKAVLSLGGGFGDPSKTAFYAPYIMLLRDIEDPYNQSIVIGENVRLREQPASNSNIIASLSWNLVTMIPQTDFHEETIGGETHSWQYVKTHDGKTGYVFGKYIRSPNDFRAGFQLYDGKWLMDRFLAGD